MDLLKEEGHLPVKQRGRPKKIPADDSLVCSNYSAMTREELMQELMKSRIECARLKKGYEVKGDGTVILYDNMNI